MTQWGGGSLLKGGCSLLRNEIQREGEREKQRKRLTGCSGKRKDLSEAQKGKGDGHTAIPRGNSSCKLRKKMVPYTFTASSLHPLPNLISNGELQYEVLFLPSQHNHISYISSGLKH